MSKRTYAIALVIALVVIVAALMLRGQGGGLLAQLGPMIHGR